MHDEMLNADSCQGFFWKTCFEGLYVSTVIEKWFILLIPPYLSTLRFPTSKTRMFSTQCFQSVSLSGPGCAYVEPVMLVEVKSEGSCSI